MKSNRPAGIVDILYPVHAGAQTDESLPVLPEESGTIERQRPQTENGGVASVLKQRLLHRTDEDRPITVPGILSLPHKPNEVVPEPDPDHVVRDKGLRYMLNTSSNVRIPEEWTKTGAYKTRTELLEARRTAARHDPQPKLSTYRTSEWGAGQRLFPCGGHEWAFTGDLDDADQDPAPQSCNSEQLRTSLLHRRRMAARRIGEESLDVIDRRHKEDAERRAYVLRSLHAQSTPRYRTNTELVHAKLQDTRRAAGLLDDFQEINVERSMAGISGVHVPNPPITTLPDLKDARKKRFVSDAAAALEEIDKYHVPPQQRVQLRETGAIVYRESKAPGKSRATLMQDRHRELREKSQQTFDGRHERPQPQIPDDWYKHSNGYVESPDEASRQHLLATRFNKLEPYNHYEDAPVDAFKSGHVRLEKKLRDTTPISVHVPNAKVKPQPDLIISIPKEPPPPKQAYLDRLQLYKEACEPPEHVPPDAFAEITEFAESFKKATRHASIPPSPFETKALFSSFSADMQYHPKPVPLPNALPAPVAAEPVIPVLSLEGVRLVRAPVTQVMSHGFQDTLAEATGATEPIPRKPAAAGSARHDTAASPSSARRDVGVPARQDSAAVYESSGAAQEPRPRAPSGAVPAGAAQRRGFVRHAGFQLVQQALA